MKLLTYVTGKRRVKGFIIPLTLFISVVILTISMGISTILIKELYFSKLSRESKIAYYSADNAMMCTLMVDDQYIDSASGLGIFPYDSLVNPNTYIQTVITQLNATRASQGLASISSDDIACATAPIFKASVSNFTATAFSRVNSVGVTENGWKSSFSMNMDLGNGTFRCASVLVYKTPLYRQIIARGFTSCTNNGQAIERAVIDTTEIK